MDSNISDLFEDIRQTEFIYLKELNELITCCKFYCNIRSNNHDTNLQIYNITISLHSSHLFFSQSILTLLDNNDPLLLVNLCNWLMEVTPIYKQYLQLYSYDPDQPERELQLKKTPIIRLKYLTNFLTKLLKLQLDKNLCDNLLEFKSIFIKELQQVKEKDQLQKLIKQTNTISFNNVKSLETLEITAANFQINNIILRNECQMTLKHPRRLAKLDLEVEIFALSKDTGIESFAVCSIESTGRSLMFPPFRFHELKIENFGDSKNLTISLIPYFCDLSNPDIILKFQFIDLSNYDIWVKNFNKLFYRNVNLKNNLTKHDKFMELSSSGLDIRLDQDQHSETPLSPTGLHKSKRLNPSLPVPVLNQTRVPLAERDNNVMPKVHSYKSMMSGQLGQLSLSSVKVKSVNEKLEAKGETTSLARTIKLADQQYSLNSNKTLNPNKLNEIKIESKTLNPVMIKKEEVIPTLNSAKIDSKTLEPVREAEPKTLNPIKQETKKVELKTLNHVKEVKQAEPKTLQPVRETEPVKEVEPHSLKPVDEIKIDSHSLKPVKDQTIKPTLSSLQSSNQSVNKLNLHETVKDDTESIVSAMESLDTSLDLTTAVDLPKSEKKSRRKSIMGLFKKNKSNKSSTSLIQHNNSSNITLTTQETIVASKSNKNINNLTIDTTLNNDSSTLPSPFAMPEVDSPSVEISQDMQQNLKNSKTLCNFPCRVSRWLDNKWELLGGKEITIKVIFGQMGGFFIGSDSDRALIMLKITNSASVRRSTLLDIQLKTEDSGDRMISHLVRCSTGPHAEMLVKALELCKQDIRMPLLNTRGSLTSLNSASSNSLSSLSILSKHGFNSMTSITNNNNLTDDILSLGKPKVGGSLFSPRSTSSSPTDLYFTPMSSATDLNFNVNSPHSVNSNSSQLLLLLLMSTKIRVHEKIDTKWEPKSISLLELHALESVPDVYQLKISETSINELIKMDNVLRVGKAGVLLSILKDEESSEYMLEFKNKKTADAFFQIVGKV